MKKARLLIAIVFALVLFAGIASAQEWEPVYCNQLTIGWNAVSTLANGDPIPAEDSVEYEVSLMKLPDGEPVVLGRTATLNYVVTIPDEGEYIVAVAAVRLCADGTESVSELNWSNVDGESTPNPFSAILRIPPSNVTGLHY